MRSTSRAGGLLWVSFAPRKCAETSPQRVIIWERTRPPCCSPRRRSENVTGQRLVARQVLAIEDRLLLQLAPEPEI